MVRSKQQTKVKCKTVYNRVSLATRSCKCRLSIDCFKNNE